MDRSIEAQPGATQACMQPSAASLTAVNLSSYLLVQRSSLNLSVEISWDPSQAEAEQHGSVVRNTSAIRVA